jgi:hypothetical protein
MYQWNKVTCGKSDNDDLRSSYHIHRSQNCCHVGEHDDIICGQCRPTLS